MKKLNKKRNSSYKLKGGPFKYSTEFQHIILAEKENKPGEVANWKREWAKRFPPLNTRDFNTFRFHYSNIGPRNKRGHSFSV